MVEVAGGPLGWKQGGRSGRGRGLSDHGHGSGTRFVASKGRATIGHLMSSLVYLEMLQSILATLEPHEMV